MVLFATHLYPILLPCSSLKMLCKESSELVIPITQLALKFLLRPFKSKSLPISTEEKETYPLVYSFKFSSSPSLALAPIHP